MWILPLAAALVAFAFAGFLVRRSAGRSPLPHQLLWAVALVMYGAASLAVALGAANDWSRSEFLVYWALGAVLNVPFLAAGEVVLLVRHPAVLALAVLALIAVSVITFVELGDAPVRVDALREALPSGKEVFGDGSPAHRLPQLISIPSYLILVAGALWSAWRMRGRPELKGRFTGTLLVVVGATVTAVAGSILAAAGALVAFSVVLLAGVSLMFWGFLRASRPAASLRAR